MVWKNKW